MKKKTMGVEAQKELEILQRYKIARSKIDPHLQFIINITEVLGLLQHAISPYPKVDLQTFGFIFEYLNERSLDIQERMDDLMTNAEVDEILENTE